MREDDVADERGVTYLMREDDVADERGVTYLMRVILMTKPAVYSSPCTTFWKMMGSAPFSTVMVMEGRNCTSSLSSTASLLVTSACSLTYCNGQQGISSDRRQGSSG